MGLLLDTVSGSMKEILFDEKGWGYRESQLPRRFIVEKIPVTTLRRSNRNPFV